MPEMYYEDQLIKDQKFQNITKEHCKFVDCTFENCLFEDCSILSCTFLNCRFYNCTILTLTARYSEVKNTVFQKCNLIGIHCWHELLSVKSYAHPIEKLTNCHVKYNSFHKMSFRKFDFSGNIIQESIFEESDLQESDFRRCRLENTQFFKCDIRKADFRDAQGYVIDLPSAKIKQTKFSYPEVLSLLYSLDIKID